MIRLTELSRDDGNVRLRLEGDLDEEALTLLDQLLQEYGETIDGVMILECDGLTTVTPRVGARPWPLGVVFSSSRPAQVELLRGYGVRALLRE